MPPLFSPFDFGGPQMQWTRGTQMPPPMQAPLQQPEQSPPPNLMQPMPQPSPQPQQAPQGGFQGLLGGLEQGISSPLFQAGIGLMSSGVPGLQQGLKTGAELRTLPLERQLKEAQIDWYKARAAGKGVEAPSNVREWEYFNRLNPAQQQQYLTMKRAEKYLDTETGFVRPNPVTGEVAPVVSKDVAGAATARKAGEATGQAQGQLPLSIAAGERIIGNIDKALADPALGRVTGSFGGRAPNWSEGAQRAQSRVDQVVGGAFLQAYNDLRGAGSISEREGAAASAAYTRLKTQTMGDTDYREALKEFREEVRKLMGIARDRAAGRIPPLGAAEMGDGPQSGAGGGDSGWSARELD